MILILLVILILGYYMILNINKKETFIDTPINKYISKKCQYKKKKKKYKIYTTFVCIDNRLLKYVNNYKNYKKHKNIKTIYTPYNTEIDISRFTTYIYNAQ